MLLSTISININYIKILIKKNLERNVILCDIDMKNIVGKNDEEVTFFLY